MDDSNKRIQPKIEKALLQYFKEMREDRPLVVWHNILMIRTAIEKDPAHFGLKSPASYDQVIRALEQMYKRGDALISPFTSSWTLSDVKLMADGRYHRWKEWLHARDQEKQIH